jgi:hypothetical protein
MPAFKAVNRVPYNPTDLSLFAAAAGAMFGYALDAAELLPTLLVKFEGPGTT